MSEQNNHIISKFKWEGSFDKKEKANELQERISSWSKNHMHKEIAHIFDGVCPSEQTWKIRSLELNLGKIDFNNLESDLSIQLRQQLTDKLFELILYPYEKSNIIEIINEDSSHVNMLRTFLVSGLMPWNYTSSDESVNKLMACQLKSNKQNTIAMIRGVGEINENIRKRIAWQFHEENIIKIIEGLEKNSHEVIINFSNELIEIQQQGSIVQANKQDFKKKLWFWILNYLFTDRGTIFNKVAFMKSSIQQMSNHYNIEYNELVSMIERAVENVTASSGKKTDFILVIHIISKENEYSKNKSANKTEQKTDYWIVLDQLFKNSSARKTNSKKNEFNELVSGLSQENKSKFRELIISMGSSKNLWSPVINDLNDECIEIIFHAIIPVRANILIESIHFLNKLNKEMNLKIERNVLWEIGIDFLLNNKNSTFDSNTFLNYTFSKLSKNNVISKEDWLSQFTVAKISSSSKTISTLEIYSTITSIYMEEMKQNNAAFSKKQFKEMLHSQYIQISTKKTNYASWKFIQAQLIQYIQLNPTAALEVLVNYKYKNQLLMMMPFFLGNEQVKMLSKSINRTTALLLDIQKAMQKLKKENKWTELIENIEDELINIGIITLILNPKISMALYIDFIIKKLALIIETSKQSHFYEFTKELLSHKILIRNSSSLILAPIKEKGESEKNESGFIQQLKKQILSKKGKQWYLSQSLKLHFNNSAFKQLRHSVDKDSELIFYYLIADTKQRLEDVLQEYIQLFGNKKTGISNSETSYQIIELFWKCLLNYSGYNGNLSRFKKITTAAMMLRFKTFVSKKNVSIKKNKWHSSNANSIQLKNGQVLSLKQVYHYIKQALNNEQSTITHEEQYIQLNELLTLAIEQEATMVKIIFYQTNITDKRIRFLQTIIDWQQLNVWLANDLLSEEKEALNAVLTLYDLTVHLSSENNSSKWMQFFWKYTWNIIKAKTNSNELFNQLVSEVVYAIAQNKGVTLKYILKEIRANRILIPTRLKNSLTANNSNFSSIAEALPIKITDNNLLHCEQLGLIEQLIHDLIVYKKIPIWYSNTNQDNKATLFQKLLETYPTIFATIIKGKNIPQLQKQNLHELINFKQLSCVIRRFEKNKKQLISLLESFYNKIGQLYSNSISGKEIQQILFQKIIIAWTEDNWNIVSVENIWQELIWEVETKKRQSKKELLLAAEKIKYSFPLSIQVALEFISKNDAQKAITKEQTISSLLKKQLLETKKNVPLKTGIAVKNAGIVLLNNYIRTLFERLGFLKDEQFIDHSSQLNAVHYLQYVSTGLSKTEEALLPLNKILCGLPLSSPVPEGITITYDQKQLIDSLIKAVLGHWPSVGNSSINGFRGNWLVRDGLLTEKEDRWELIVEKRVYDLLIHQSPFSFSIIKYPWMEKPMHVTWPY